MVVQLPTTGIKAITPGYIQAMQTAWREQLRTEGVFRCTLLKFPDTKAINVEACCE